VIGVGDGQVRRERSGFGAERFGDGVVQVGQRVQVALDAGPEDRRPAGAELPAAGQAQRDLPRPRYAVQSALDVSQPVLRDLAEEPHRDVPPLDCGEPPRAGGQPSPQIE
jgi:hypothetical protein